MAVSQFAELGSANFQYFLLDFYPVLVIICMIITVMVFCCRYGSGSFSFSRTVTSRFTTEVELNEVGGA